MNQYTTDIKVGELLVKAGVITEDNLTKAVQTAQAENLHLGLALVKNGALTVDELRLSLIHI